MPKAWPILDLDAGASETEVRHAYAAQLRLRRPDDDSAGFQALRAEYEFALATARSQTLAGYHAPALRTVSPSPFDAVEVAANDDAAFARERVLGEIRDRLDSGDVLAACDRYDRARSRGEIGIDDEQEIEMMLARSAMANDTLGTDGLAKLAQRYRWNDAVSRFPLGEQIVERIRPLRPGERYVGQWNWGAFCLTPFWLIAHRRPLYGALFLIFALPSCFTGIGFVVVTGYVVHCGRNGNAIAVRHRTFESDEQFVRVQNAWRNWGVPIFALALTSVFVAIIALIRAPVR